MNDPSTAFPTASPTAPATAPGRQGCLVPDCRRTRHDDGRHHEWICARHWKETPVALRGAHLRAVAELNRVRRSPDGASDDAEGAVREAALRWSACRDYWLAEGACPRVLDRLGLR